MENMVKKQLLLLLFLSLNFVSHNLGKIVAEESYLTIGEEYGKPLLVLLETNPWLMVIGSDSPSFVLYDSGKLIYTIIENNNLKRHLTVLSQDEMKDFIEYLTIDKSIYDLEDFIESSTWTDQPFTIIYLDIVKTKKIVVYGSIARNPEARNNTPFAFIQLYDKIKNYTNENSVEWIPPKIEIMFWDYDYAPNKRDWIDGFPDLNSPSTINHGNDFYSVFIDGNKYEILVNYLRNMGEREAVEINGKKMAISYRIPFPNIDELKLLFESEEEEYDPLFY